MTADMAFEGLIVSHDAGLYSVFDRVLRQLSISTNICLSASKACNQLQQGSTDLLVIDCDGQDWSEVLDRVWKSKSTKKPTVVAITRKEDRVPGAHVVLKKPVTVESGALSLKAAYHRMLHDYRRHARFALMTPVIATDAEEKTVPVTDYRHWRQRGWYQQQGAACGGNGSAVSVAAASRTQGDSCGSACVVGA